MHRRNLWRIYNDHGMNTMVYDLYGLTEEERRLVEESIGGERKGIGERGE